MSDPATKKTMETEPAKKVKFTKEDIEKNKTMAIVAYIIFLVPLLTDAKDSPFVKFHLKQSIALVVAWIAINVVFFVLPFLALLLGPIVSLAGLALVIIGIINANKGEAKDLPVIGKYAEQYLKF